MFPLPALRTSTPFASPINRPKGTEPARKARGMSQIAGDMPGWYRKQGMGNRQWAMGKGKQGNRETEAKR
jgi:hypothetical protein